MEWVRGLVRSGGTGVGWWKMVGGGWGMAAGGLEMKVCSRM